ncbi:MAG: hypothetical protein GX904_00930, partial [Acholeplasmataceae bacterium]|nr:hypothetical protein [Acholeplasmataceae bacterium]
MSDSELVDLCVNLAKIPQLRKFIFIVDADNPERTKKIIDQNNPFKFLGNNVYSLQIPVPEHRTNSAICIEHYYTDSELRTEKEIAGKRCRLFLGNEFDNRGISLDREYHCTAPRQCGPDKITIIDGDSKTKVTLISDPQVSLALPKTKFAEALLNEENEFSDISSENFKLIFDILKQIILPQEVTETPLTEQPAPGNAQQGISSSIST